VNYGANRRRSLLADDWLRNSPLSPLGNDATRLLSAVFFGPDAFLSRLISAKTEGMAPMVG
jgi:hypothetical protein